MFKKFLKKLVGSKNASETTGVSVKLDEQLKQLEDIDIKLNPGITKEDLLKSCPQEKFEQRPYDLLLMFMGSNREEEPFDAFSDDIWYLDAECIEGHGSYVEIAERIAKLTGGELALENIHDSIDHVKEKATLSFTCQGRDYSWKATVNNDWLDDSILSKFAQLLIEAGLERRLISHYFEGQDCLLACADVEKQMTLNNITGMKFNWLE